MSGERDLPTWLWDFETNRTIHDALPELVLEILAVITRMGDGATVVLFALLFLWFGSTDSWQRRGMLMAIAVATLALNAGLKGIFDVQRPLFAAMEAGAPLAFAPDTYPGLSTPSAHAMGSAAIYAGLAVLMTAGKRWQRYLIAGFLITTIALSRIVIGLHYVGDVVLGVGLGLLLVWFGLWLETEEPRSVLPLFGFAFIVAVLSPPFGSEEFVTLSIGAAAGGFLAWALLKNRNPDPLGASILVLGLLVVPVFIAFRVLDALVTVDILIEVAGSELPIMTGFRIVGYALLVGFAIAVPVIAEQLDDWDSVQRLQGLLPFDGRTLDAEQFDDSVAD